MRYDQMCKHRNQRTMTLEHGQLLRDSGFSRQGLHRSSLDSSVLTTTKDQTELYYLLERESLVEWYSGKRETVTTHWMDGPSTLASLPTAAECIASIRSNIKPELTRARILKQMQDMIDQLSSLPKTSCQPLKWVLPDGLQVTQSWGRSSVVTPYSYSSLMSTQSIRGSIRTEQVMMLGDQFDQPCDTSASGVPIFAQLKTRSTTASGK